MKNRNFIQAGIIVLFISLIVSACGGNKETASTTPSETAGEAMGLRRQMALR